jgi:hypothetical protein
MAFQPLGEAANGPLSSLPSNFDLEVPGCQAQKRAQARAQGSKGVGILFDFVGLSNMTICRFTKYRSNLMAIRRATRYS